MKCIDILVKIPVPLYYICIVSIKNIYIKISSTIKCLTKSQQSPILAFSKTRLKHYDVHSVFTLIYMNR